MIPKAKKLNLPREKSLEHVLKMAKKFPTSRTASLPRVRSLSLKRKAKTFLINRTPSLLIRELPRREVTSWMVFLTRKMLSKTPSCRWRQGQESPSPFVGHRV